MRRSVRSPVPAARTRDQVFGRHAGLHDRFDLAFARQPDRFGDGFCRAGRRHDLEPARVDAGRPRQFLDPALRAYQHWRNQAFARCSGNARHRIGIGGIHHRCRHGGKLARPDAAHEFAKAHVLVVETHLRQRHLGPAHLFLRRDHVGAAGDDHFLVLVDAKGIQRDVPLFAFFLHADLDRDGVANLDRPLEAQVLAKVDRSRPWKLGPEHGGDQRTAPHAVANHFAKPAVHRVIRIDVRGVDIA
jgi:hypothetical protein